MIINLFKARKNVHRDTQTNAHFYSKGANYNFLFLFFGFLGMASRSFLEHFNFFLATIPIYDSHNHTGGRNYGEHNFARTGFWQRFRFVTRFFTFRTSAFYVNSCTIGNFTIIMIYEDSIRKRIGSTLTVRYDITI